MGEGPDPLRDLIMAFLPRHLTEASADSVFAGLGLAPGLIATIDSNAYSGLTRRDPTSGSISLMLNESLTKARAPSILAHEMAHVQQFKGLNEEEAVEGRPGPDPAFVGIQNIFEGRYADMSTAERAKALEWYLEGTLTPEEYAQRQEMSLERLLSNPSVKREIQAEAVQRGFDHVRQLSQKPKEEVLKSLGELDNVLPGSRAAFNLFLRRLNDG